MLGPETVMRISRDLIGRIGRFRTTSVLAPLLAPLIITSLVALIVTAGAGVDHPLTWMLWYLFGAVVVVILLFYCIWSYANPDRLQTEEYRLEEQRIRIIGDERHPGPVLIDSAAQLTSNTAVRSSSK
jgi:hypothetical protein